ncbi:MAG: PQQ-binding-like beta-propeller repeat protein, partial [Gemmatimonadales bacterium]|nr:PQQ-binding-like beta-propeller repeat protein [Gemmatimonadales bacterium]
MGMVDNDNPQLVAVDARSGIERWRAALGQEDGRERFAGVPVASAGCVFLVSGESGSREPRAVRVHAFDGRTGTERWSVPVSTASDTSMLLG